MPADDQLCPNCGKFSSANAEACECGFRFSGMAAPPPPSAFGAYPRGGAPNAPAYGNTGQEGIAIAGMVCGIVAIVTVCLWPISVLCSIAGIILSAFGMKSRNRGMAIAGLVCSILAFLLTGLMFLGLFALMSAGNQFGPPISK